MDVKFVSDCKDAINHLRVLAKTHGDMDAEQAKNSRWHLYQQTGKFGRKFMELIKEFEELNRVHSDNPPHPDVR